MPTAIPQDRTAGVTPPDRPIDHHVTDHTVADPDKPGHPWSRPALHRPQPLPTATLDTGPSSDVQHSPQRRSPAHVYPQCGWRCSHPAPTTTNISRPSDPDRFYETNAFRTDAAVHLFVP